MGGLKVDKLFENLLEKLFSKQNMQLVKKEAYDEWIKVQTDFEKAKRKIKQQNNIDTISIGTSKSCPWNRDHYKKLPKADKKDVELKAGGRLVISTSIIKDMINQVAVSIKNHIDAILKEIDIKTLNAILMVGGLSNSPIVLEEMKKLVNDQVQIIVPGNAELSIVMGAVLFGWKSNVIRVRKSRMTYGITMDNPFIEGFHDKNRSYIDKCETQRCQSCFHKLITVNQDIEVNQHIELISNHSYESGLASTIPLLATADENPKYEDDTGVQKIGEILIPCTEESHGKKIIINLYFGHTEIHMKVFDESTQKTYEDCFDFLYENQAKFVE